eukprot:11371726-Ditylum_brightwellii.AAC.1
MSGNCVHKTFTETAQTWSVSHVQATYHPADATSPTYKLSIPFFGKGTPEEWIQFWHWLQAVLKDQNITQGPASYA